MNRNYRKHILSMFGIMFPVLLLTIIVSSNGNLMKLMGGSIRIYWILIMVILVMLTVPHILRINKSIKNNN